MIPMLDLTGQYRTLQPEIDRAMQEVAAGGQYILGANVSAFEQEVAAYLGAPRALGCASGTDALFLALKALGIGPGDQVLTTPFSFIATCEAISLCGAEPIFADVDPLTLNLDPAAAGAAVTPRTRALLPVHLFGRPADLPALSTLARRRGLAMVEDCAQAIGARTPDRGGAARAPAASGARQAAFRSSRARTWGEWATVAWCCAPMTRYASASTCCGGMGGG